MCEARNVEFSDGALHGVHVLDLTRLLPGAYCTQLLGDLGADVLKVEEPLTGDYLRWAEPLNRKESGQFLALNRNKRSLTLNLKTQKGREIFLALAARADVVLEGFRPGTMERLRLGYPAVSAANPRIVYCSMSGFGQDGPYRTVPGHDLNYLGIAGALELFGAAEGPPVVPGLPLADIGGGALMATVGILAALMARQSDGKGQFIDIAMVDGVVSWLSFIAGRYFVDGRVPRRGQSESIGGAPCYNIYEDRDGRHLTIGCFEEKFWRALCEALRVPELIQLQWATEGKGLYARAKLQSIFRTQPRDHWIELLRSHDVCVGPSNTLEEAFRDQHIVHRKMLTEVLHPVEGRFPQIANPIKLSRTPGGIRRPPPTLGEHTCDTLQELGYDVDAVEALRAAGVV